MNNLKKFVHQRASAPFVNYTTTKKKGTKILQTFVKLAKDGNKKELEKFGFRTETGRPGYFTSTIDEEDEEFLNAKFESDDVLTKEKIDRIFEEEENELLKLTPEKAQKKFQTHHDEDEEDVEVQTEQEFNERIQKKVDEKTTEIGAVDFPVTDDEIVEWGLDFVQNTEESRRVYKYNGKERVSEYLSSIPPPLPNIEIDENMKKKMELTEEESKITIQDIDKFQNEFALNYAKNPVNVSESTAKLKFHVEEEPQLEEEEEVKEKEKEEEYNFEKKDTMESMIQEMLKNKNIKPEDITQQKLQEMEDYYNNNKNADQATLFALYETEKVKFYHEMFGDTFSKEQIEQVVNSKTAPEEGTDRMNAIFDGALAQMEGELKVSLTELLKTKEMQEQDDLFQKAMREEFENLKK